MRRIRLMCGKVATVDDEDGWQAEYRWHMHTNGYAERKKGGKTVLLHREVLGLSAGDINVDHINGKKLDCRKSNLRLANQSQNLMNSRKPRRKNGTSSKWKGVCKSRDKWRADISVDGRSMYLGTFATQTEAAKAYDAAARKHYGDFAKCNFKAKEE